MSASRVSFFFFQAEDGIRDLIVTGVQTCALPICVGVDDPQLDVVAALVEPDQVGADVAAAVDAPLADPLRQLRNHQIVAVELLRLRSEERRVGKECRSRWSPYH